LSVGFGGSRIEGDHNGTLAFSFEIEAFVHRETTSIGALTLKTTGHIYSSRGSSMARPNVREQLIDAGLRTLHLHGFNGTGVQDITDAAGVPKGSFYNHFDSKEDMALQALDRYWQNGAERRGLLSDASLDPVERLRRYFRGLSEIAVRQSFQNGCMIGNFSTELSVQSKEVRDRLAEIYAAWSRSIESCVREAEKAGRVQPRLPAATIAAFLLNTWEGAVLRSKVEQDKTPFEQFERVVFASIFT
jgi:TetR/AcrR family transcriptional repressor of nem operon